MKTISESDLAVNLGISRQTLREARKSLPPELFCQGSNREVRYPLEAVQAVANYLAEHPSTIDTTPQGDTTPPAGAQTPSLPFSEEDSADNPPPPDFAAEVTAQVAQLPEPTTQHGTIIKVFPKNPNLVQAEIPPLGRVLVRVRKCPFWRPGLTIEARPSGQDRRLYICTSKLPRR